MDSNTARRGRRPRRSDWPLFTTFSRDKKAALERDFGVSARDAALFVRITESSIRWFNRMRRSPRNIPELRKRLSAFFGTAAELRFQLQSWAWPGDEGDPDAATRDLFRRGLEHASEDGQAYKGPVPTLDQLRSLPQRLFPAQNARKKGVAPSPRASELGRDLGEELALRAITDFSGPGWQADDGGEFIRGMILGFVGAVERGAWDGWQQVEQWRRGASEDDLMREFILRLDSGYRFVCRDEVVKRAAFTRYVALALEAAGEQPRSIPKVRDLVAKYAGKAGSLHERRMALSWAALAAQRKRR